MTLQEEAAYLRSTPEKILSNREKKFQAYIDHCNETITRIVHSGGELLIPYKNRWAKSYRKGILKKFYQAHSWFKRHGLKTGMLSLTSAQTGYTDEEILIRLSESWDKFFDNVRKRGYQCLKIYEPHESGVAHIHVLIFGSLVPDDIDYMEHLWVEKYEMGDGKVDRDGKQHAFDFSDDFEKSIDSLVNYLMKYLSKTVISDFENDLALLRFHSLFYVTGKRMFSCSRYLSRVMGIFRIPPKIKVHEIWIGEKEVYDRSLNSSYPKRHQQISKKKIEQSCRDLNGLLVKKGFSVEDLVYLPDVLSQVNAVKKKNSYHFDYKLLPFEIKNVYDVYHS